MSIIIYESYLEHSKKRKYNSKKNYKYYAKVPIKGDVFRYFYTKESYLAYINGKKDSKENVSKIKSRFDSFTSKVKNTISKIDDNRNSIKKSTDKFIETSKSKLSSVIKKGEKKTKQILSKKHLSETSEDIKTKLSPIVNKGKEKTQKILSNKKIASSAEPKIKLSSVIKKGEEKVQKTMSSKGSTKSSASFSSNIITEGKKIAIAIMSGVLGIDATDSINYVFNEWLAKTETGPGYTEDATDFSQLRKKDTSWEKYEDQAAINKNYNNDLYTYEYTQNCSYCTVAYDLRQRGYDVVADAISEEELYEFCTTEDMISLYEGAECVSLKDIIEKRGDPVDQIFKKQGVIIEDVIDAERDLTEYSVPYVYREHTNKALKKELLSHGEGARGNLLLSWSSGGGHSVVWEVQNGQLYIRDCQTNETYVGSDIYDYHILFRADNVAYIRTDNLEPTDECLKRVRNRQ